MSRTEIVAVAPKLATRVRLHLRDRGRMSFVYIGLSEERPSPKFDLFRRTMFIS